MRGTTRHETHGSEKGLFFAVHAAVALSFPFSC